MEIIDHPADIGFKVVGSSLKEAYMNAGKALYSLLLTSPKRDSDTELNIEIRSEDLLSLTYDYLEQLLILFETDGFVPNKIHICLKDEEEGHLMHVRLEGFTVNLTEAELNYKIKAVTYHLMEVEPYDKGWYIKVILDI